jgi:NAD(P)H-dependent flavin oxidoreductase YrpB (nitropropane dioxygenase family)
VIELNREAERGKALASSYNYVIVGAGSAGCVVPPNAEARGDIDSMDLLAGQSVGLVREIKPAGQIVHELVEEARQIIARRLLGLVQPA